MVKSIPSILGKSDLIIKPRHSVEDDEQMFVRETLGAWNVDISYNPEGEFVIFEQDWDMLKRFFFTHLEDINSGNTYNVSKYEIIVERDGITKNYLWKEGGYPYKKDDRIS